MDKQRSVTVSSCHRHQGRPHPEKSGILDKVREELRKRHYSSRTEEAYAGWIRRFIRFHGFRNPREMGEIEVEQYLSFLATEKKVAPATQNQALEALLFLYKEGLGERLDWLDDVVRAKKPRRLPIVSTRQEIQGVLAHLHGPKWLAAMLLYGAGLRLLECLQLRVKDIDFGYRQIIIRGGKGNRDRITILPGIVESNLRCHLDSMKRSIEPAFGSMSPATPPATPSQRTCWNTRFQPHGFANHSRLPKPPFPVSIMCLEQVFRLSVAERVQLAEDLWDSVASSPEKIATTDAQRKELDRRLKAHAKDPSAALPWDEVRRRVAD